MTGCLSASLLPSLPPSFFLPSHCLGCVLCRHQDLDRDGHHPWVGVISCTSEVHPWPELVADVGGQPPFFVDRWLVPISLLARLSSCHQFQGAAGLLEAIWMEFSSRGRGFCSTQEAMGGRECQSPRGYGDLFPWLWEILPW